MNADIKDLFIIIILWNIYKRAYEMPSRPWGELISYVITVLSYTECMHLLIYADPFFVECAVVATVH